MSKSAKQKYTAWFILLVAIILMSLLKNGLPGFTALSRLSAKVFDVSSVMSNPYLDKRSTKSATSFGLG